MGNDTQQAQFEAGLRNVANGVIDGLSKLQITLTTKQVDWSAWRVGKPLPKSLRIEFKPDGAPAMHFMLTGAQIADSWDGLQRPDVRQKVSNLVSHYAKLKTGTGKV